MIERFQAEATLTGDHDEDDFIRANPNAALLGMLFDQRVRAEYAFTGPKRLHDRLGHLDMKQIAKIDEEELKQIFAQKPAVHRFTNNMATYTSKLSKTVVEKYDGDATLLWAGEDFSIVKKRLVGLPGFGPQKAEKMKFVLHYFGFCDYS